MTDDSIQNKVHIVTEDRSLKDNKLFDTFLYSNIKTKKGCS